MSFSKDSLPLYAANGELHHYASFTEAERLISAGRVECRGTRGRVRSLVALSDSEEWLCLPRPQAGQRYSHNHETETNPRGVWTHKLRQCLSYGT